MRCALRPPLRTANPAATRVRSEAEVDAAAAGAVGAAVSLRSHHTARMRVASAEHSGSRPVGEVHPDQLGAVFHWKAQVLYWAWVCEAAGFVTDEQ